MREEAPENICRCRPYPVANCLLYWPSVWYLCARGQRLVCRLGVAHPQPGLHSRTRVFPPGLLATWTDPEKGYTFFSTVSSCGPGSAAGESPKPGDALAHADAAADTAAESPVAAEAPASADAAAAATAEAPREASQGTEQAVAAALSGGEAAHAPEFLVRVKACAAPKDADEADAALDDAVTVARSRKDPDSAWREAFALQRIALTLPRATVDVGGAAVAADGGRSDADAERVESLRRQPPLLDLLQQATLPPLHWGMLLFGLASVPVLQAIEGQAAVEQCEGYVYSEVRLACAADTTRACTPQRLQFSPFFSHPRLWPGTPMATAVR